MGGDSGAVDPRDPMGQTIRHTPRAIPFTLVGGDPECIQAVSDHVEANLGPIDTVMHEIVSDLVHLDVHVVRPDEGAGRPWWTLVTSGMSECPMTMPKGLEHLRFAELMIRLPPEWPVLSEELKDERWYWPVRWLKELARLPHEYGTWLGFGHTVPNGDPPEPYAEGTRFCGMLVLPAFMNVPESFAELQIGPQKSIQFYSLFPLYGEEMAYKLQHGADALLDRFAKAGVSDVVDVGRKNTCRRKRFGLW